MASDKAVVEWTVVVSGHHRELVRPQIAAFAVEMERVLQANDHKRGWKDMKISDIFSRIKDEFEELDEAHAVYIYPHISDSGKEFAINAMRDEAIDIANFCMFLCHNYPEEGAK